MIDIIQHEYPSQEIAQILTILREQKKEKKDQKTISKIKTKTDCERKGNSND